MSLQNALKEAEDKSGGSIEQVIVSINGISFETFHKTETLHFKEKQTLITSQDIDSLLLDIEEKTLLLHPNNMCIDIVPGNFEYNRTSSFIKPIGVTANSLSASALVIMLKKQEFQTILSLFRELKKEILKIIPSIEAARTAILTKKQTSKQLCLVDIGGETISIGIYRDGNLTSYGVYPFGSENLTNTISKELAISYTLASRIKHGDHSIYLSPLQKETYTQISNTFIDDVFGTISYHIENIKTGATITLIDTVFIGGGSLFSDLQTAIKKEARFIHTKPNLELLLIHKRKLESIIYAISFGLILVHINLIWFL